MPTVSIKNLNESVTTENNKTIFDALEEENIELSHGCLAGSCGACRVFILEGAENLSEPSEVESNTLASLMANYKRIHGEDFFEGKTLRLACRAKIKGDITIEELD
ncbi:MAG: hypothetical protein CME62_08155 [Halobacteriovoraceae bacterium]|nr:hypothetical protein [Halobacteriovoraceae bacterium]|tara:strand:+ start:3982 stop:4299 length:318 start_codon:yes stop_codon:yes gene_type:complete